MVEAAKNKLLLINPSARRMKAINKLALKGVFPNACNCFLAFVKG